MELQYYFLNVEKLKYTKFYDYHYLTRIEATIIAQNWPLDLPCKFRNSNGKLWLNQLFESVFAKRNRNRQYNTFQSDTLRKRGILVQQASFPSRKPRANVTQTSTIRFHYFFESRQRLILP